MRTTMKKLYTLLVAVFITASTFAQAPEKMSYQAVIRDATGNLISNQAVGIQISILQTTVEGTAVYVETQTPTTNTNGLLSLEIGTGTIVTGSFTAIDWSANSYFIKTETDPTGGTNYTITGTSQLLSVPYALYAKTSGNGAGPIGPQGEPGIKTLINTIDETAGDNCENGGVKIEVGSDTNDNGVLDTEEVDETLTRYVCNGTVGNGSNGNNQTLIYTINGF